MKRKIFLILLAIILIVVFKSTEEVSIIPDSAIRLRVIPNSNNPYDISIKEQIKSYLEKDVYTLTKNTNTIEEARLIINDNLDSIDANIKNILNNNDYPLPYKINYGSNYFPVKTYQGITYKEGYYESLVISLGDAKGDTSGVYYFLISAL